MHHNEYLIKLFTAHGERDDQLIFPYNDRREGARLVRVRGRSVVSYRSKNKHGSTAWRVIIIDPLQTGIVLPGISTPVDVVAAFFGVLRCKYLLHFLQAKGIFPASKNELLRSIEWIHSASIRELKCAP